MQDITEEQRSTAAAFAAATSLEGERKYWVRFIRGGIVERQFEFAASDSATACAENIAAANGAKVDVMPIAKWREKQREWAELTAKVRASGLPSDAELVRRKDERAPISAFEQQYMRDHGAA